MDNFIAFFIVYGQIIGIGLVAAGLLLRHIRIRRVHTFPADIGIGE